MCLTFNSTSEISDRGRKKLILQHFFPLSLIEVRLLFIHNFLFDHLPALQNRKGWQIETKENFLVGIDWMQIPTSCLMHIHDAPNCLSNRLNMFWFVRTQTNRQNFWMDRYLDFFPKKFPKLALDQLYQSEYTFLLQMLKTKIRRITWFKVKHILLHTN